MEDVERFDEEVIRSHGAENGGQQPGPEAAEVRGDHDRRAEGEVYGFVAHHRVKYVRPH